MSTQLGCVPKDTYILNKPKEFTYMTTAKRRTKKPIINPTIYRAVCAVMALLLLFSSLMTGISAWKSEGLAAQNNLFTTAKAETYSVQLTKFLDGDETVRINGAGFDLYRVKQGAETEDVKINGAVLYTAGTGENAGVIEVDGLVKGDYYFKEVVRAPGYKLPTGTAAVKEFTIETGSPEVTEVKFYNERQLASLTVTKTVKNADHSPLSPQQKTQEFEFTVKLEGVPDGNINVDLNGVTKQFSIVNSQFSIRLKHADTAEIFGLPEGAAYLVSETLASGYSESSDNNSGNIHKDGSNAAFTNTYTGDFGELKITKTVTNGGSTTKGFDFYPAIGDPADATEYTYKLNGAGADITFRNGDKITLADGETAEFDRLLAGTSYSVTENEYTGYVTSATGSTGTIVKPGVTAAFTNKFEAVIPGAGNLTITKTVTGTAGDTSELFDFTVILGDASDTATAYSYTLNGGAAQTFHNGYILRLKDGDVALFTDLPNDLFYSVNEDEKDYIKSSIGATGTITDAGVTAAFTNHKDTPPPPEYGSIETLKILAGEGADADKLFTFTVTFSTADSFNWTIDGTAQPQTIKSGDTFEIKKGQKVKISGIPVGTHYTVTENNDTTNFYSRSALVNGEGSVINGNIPVQQTNTYVGPVYIPINGTKTWDHGNNPLDKQPTEITVILKADGIEAGRKTVTAADHWEYSFSMPKYQADSITPVLYTIEESPVAGYTSEITGKNIKNTFIPVAVIHPSVTKIITGTPNSSSTFTFEMTAVTPNAPMPAGSVNGKSAMTITGADTRNFGDIVFDTAGTYEYKISEVGGGAAGYIYDNTVYTMTVTVTKTGSVISQTTEYKKQDGTAASGLVFTNKYESGVPVSVKVTKVWDDGNSAARPQTTAIQLYKNGSAVGGEKVTLSQENNWTHTWQNLDGNATWTVDEPIVPDGYTKKITGNAVIGFVITNQRPHDPPSDTVTISGKKIWNHGDNPASARPNSITIYIYDGNTLVLTDTVSEKEHWSFNYKLPKYRADGSETSYRIDEANVPGYTKKINGFTITNNHDSYNPQNEKTVISGAKTWQHGNIAVDRRPEGITVYVKDGSRIVAEKYITAANDWKWNISVLKYREDGETVIHYTVDEANVPYYTCKIDGYNITNTFKGMDYPGDSPKTGDNSNMTLWVILMLASAATLTILLITNKRYKGKHVKN